MNAINVHIRWIIKRDLKEILEIEQQSFEFPWSEKDFRELLASSRTIGLIAEHDDSVLGFMIYELHKSRLHLRNFAVHPDFRRRGIGKSLTVKLQSRLSPNRRTRILLEVSERNLPAQLFWRAQGFKAISTLKNFYETDEDAYLMEYRIQRESLVVGG